MIFIINDTNKTAFLHVVQDTPERQSLQLQIGTDTSYHELFWTKDKGVMEAVNKRFSAGVTKLKKDLISCHDFYLGERLIAFTDIPHPEIHKKTIEGVQIQSIPMALDQRTEEEKRATRNIIIVISNVSDQLRVSMNDARNLVASTSFVTRDYQFDMLAIKWTSWKSLKYRAALYLTNLTRERGFELGVGPADAKRPHNNLLPMTSDELNAFKKENEETQRQQMAKKVESQSRPLSSRPSINPPTGSKPGNSRGNGNGQPSCRKKAHTGGKGTGYKTHR